MEGLYKVTIRESEIGQLGSMVMVMTSGYIKSSHLYLYSAFNNTNCNKALHNIKIVCQ